MKRVRFLSGLVLAAALAWSPAKAQEITDAHLQAAWAAVRALHADAAFDDALPDIAEQVKTLLMTRRPDLFREINAVVDDVALELVVRRIELNNDVARVWAQTFTQQELIEIAAFYNSPTGVKLRDMFDTLTDETIQAFQGWYERLAEEMLERSLAEFTRRGIVY